VNDRWGIAIDTGMFTPPVGIEGIFSPGSFEGESAVLLIFPLSFYVKKSSSPLWYNVFFKIVLSLIHRAFGITSLVEIYAKHHQR